MIEKLKDIEKQFNIKLETSYDSEDKVREVQLNFSSDVWLDLLNKEGELLPVCCGNISIIRDCFSDALREDGLIDADQLAKIVVNSEYHDWEEDHPVSEIKRIYEALEGCLDYYREPRSINHNDLTPFCTHEMFNKVGDFCNDYGFARILSDFNTGRCRATHNKLLLEVIPAVRILNQQISDLKTEPADGYGLVRIANNELYESNDKLALFETENQAKEVLKHWIKSKQVGKNDACIRKVRVSFEKGIEFIDSIEYPWENKKMLIDKEQASELFTDLNKLRSKNDNSFKNDKVEAILHKALTEISELK